MGACIRKMCVDGDTRPIHDSRIPDVAAEDVGKALIGGEDGNYALGTAPASGGSGIAVLGYYDSYDELVAAVASPKAGDAYGVGTVAPYTIYSWDGVGNRWVNNGTLQGPAGEVGATYTPAVSNDGVLRWTNDRGLDNPEPVNIRGPKGEDGSPGPQGPPGDNTAALEAAQVAIDAADRASAAAEAAQELVPEVTQLKSDKVDKVGGKGLSTNDYDNEAKSKVDNIPENPKYTDTVYELPVASDTELGGVKAVAKTDIMKSPVGCDNTGQLWCEDNNRIPLEDIAVTTIDEDISRFRFDFPNGKRYQRVIVYWVSPKKDFQKYNLYCNFLNGEYGSMTLLDVNQTGNVNYYRACSFDIRRVNGFCDGTVFPQSTSYSADPLSVLHRDSLTIEKSPEIREFPSKGISGINIYTSSGQTIPSGVTIIIKGVPN